MKVDVTTLTGTNPLTNNVCAYMFVCVFVFILLCVFMSDVCVHNISILWMFILQLLGCSKYVCVDFFGLFVHNMSVYYLCSHVCKFVCVDFFNLFVHNMSVCYERILTIFLWILVCAWVCLCVCVNVSESCLRVCLYEIFSAVLNSQLMGTNFVR